MKADVLEDLAGRIDKAAAVLDLEQKVRLLTGAAMFALHAEAAIGLGEVRLSDGPTGVRGPEFTGGRMSCLLPNATLRCGVAECYRVDGGRRGLRCPASAGSTDTKDVPARRRFVMARPPRLVLRKVGVSGPRTAWFRRLSRTVDGLEGADRIGGDTDRLFLVWGGWGRESGARLAHAFSEGPGLLAGPH